MSVSPFDVVAECDLIEARCLLLPAFARGCSGGSSAHFIMFAFPKKKLHCQLNCCL